MTTTADDDLAFAGPAALAELVRRGEVQPRELVELCAAPDRGAEPAPERVPGDDGRRGARRRRAPTGAERSARRGPDRGQGRPSGRRASRRRAARRSYGPPAPADAEAVRRLRAAGAIPIGITNVPELTIFPWTATDANGVTRNPWDLTRTPGGSSGGSAAAVAAGLVPCATGLGRRRLDPDSRRRVRARGDEADPRSRVDGSPAARAGSV